MWQGLPAEASGRALGGDGHTELVDRQQHGPGRAQPGREVAAPAAPFAAPAQESRQGEIARGATIDWIEL